MCTHEPIHTHKSLNTYLCTHLHRHTLCSIFSARDLQPSRLFLRWSLGSLGEGAAQQGHGPVALSFGGPSEPLGWTLVGGRTNEVPGILSPLADRTALHPEGSSLFPAPL